VNPNTMIRCEWGAKGIEALREETDVFIIVDVLSFTTCVDVVTGRGAFVYPCTWNDFRSREFAQEIGGVLAGSSRQPGLSLSPASLADIPAGTRLVLPSPNGSTLSLLTGDTPTLAGCLRNAHAVAQAAQRLGKRISLIPGGERWKDDLSLRPAIEDWLGAGAILSYLNGDFSPEAELARTSFLHAKDKLDWYLRASTSGQELQERGRGEDLRLAGMLNASECAPLLRDKAYGPA
jgi:2-phosphosulfolactate phosphatase